MKTYDRVWFFCALLVVFMCVMLVAPAWAGGVTQSNDMNNQTSGDVSVSGAVTNSIAAGDNIGGDLSGGNSNVSVSGDKNRAYAFGNSLGDVDIAGCLGSTQWNTPLFGRQKLVVNWPCLAEFYLRNGMYDNAAMAICNTEVRQEFETEEDCRAAHPFEAMSQPAPVPTESEDEDEEHDQIRAELADLTATVAALEREKVQLVSRVQKAEKAAQRAYTAPQEAGKELRRRLDAFEERRQAARMALEGEK